MAAQLSISNPQPRKLAGPELLHELVPTDGTANNHIAIDYFPAGGTATQHLEYQDFHRRANVLAHKIRNICNQSTLSKPQHLIIPILIPQCPDLYISQLATLKAGGAFCPIVLDVPEERLRFILQDISARVILTLAEIRDRLPQLDNIEVIAVDKQDLSGEAQPPVVTLSSRHAAYVMYTSGSTGQPKGVLLSHGAATQALLAHDRYIPEFTRFLQFASPTFDVSVFEIFFPWFRGRTLVCCDRRELLNDLPATMNRLKVDAAELTPSVASSLLRTRANVPGLKVLLTIGEMLKPNVVEEFGGDAHSPGILHGMYGPTEATIHCTLQPQFEKAMSCGSIGIPLDTVSAFVVRPQADGDDGSEVVEVLPIGEEGELAVGGYQLADGYLNRDAQTKKAFVHHPDFGQLYRTGDRAKMLPGGSFECLGRISAGQVKLRGQRIELGEIEHAASKTPGCSDIVADVIAGILVVFCALDATKATAKDVTATCAKWLPAYMVPGDVVVLESLPYLASGKLDRKLLREQYAQHNQGPSEASEPQDDDTRDVLAVLSDVFGTEVRSNALLPSLGLDSISSIRVAAAIEKKGYQRPDASRVVVARTINDLIALIRQTSSQSRRASIPKPEDPRILNDVLDHPLTKSLVADIEKSFPCTAVQAAFLNETSRDSASYCNWYEFHVPGLDDLNRIHTGLQSLAHHHEMLRAGFISSSDQPWGYSTVIWRSLRDEQISRVSQFNHDFRISDEKEMLRPCTLQLLQASDGVRILLKLHHALYDQWSLDILRADLQRILCEEQPAYTASFGLVSTHYTEVTQDIETSTAFEFWQDYLKDVAPTPLPSFQPEKFAPRITRTNWCNLSVQPAAVKEKSKELGCSGPAIFQAAVAALLSSYAGTSDVTLGSIFSGRTIPVPAVERVFGPCLATLPLRIDLDSARTSAELLRAITDQSRTVQSYALTPLPKIKKAANVSPGVALYDVVFVWQANSLGENDLSDKIPIVDAANQLELSLVLEFEPTDTAIRARATFQESVISAEQVEILVQQVDALVHQILEHPDEGISHASSHLPNTLLSIANPDTQAVADQDSLVEMIQNRAASQPGATAICFAQDLDDKKSVFESITYSELEARANRAAHAMIQAGLLPDDLVSICMEKSVDLYVMFLASLKAGAGYLPLIPETPLSRIQSVLEQAQPRLCIVDPGLLKDVSLVTSTKVIARPDLDDASASSDAPQVPQNRSRVSYAVYTSGSTGTPKGVAVTVDNLHGNLAALAELYQVSPGDRLLQSCSQAFDVSVFEIFFAFYSGMCLCSATKDVLFRDFEHSIRAFQATHLSLTPTVAALVEPANVPSVKFLVTAGEAVTEKVHRSWAGNGLNQGYGPSETTNICTVNMHVSPNHVLGNIGRPFKNTSAFVIAPDDDAFRILPAGSHGEYAFGGEQVFRGYIGMDELNSKKIFDHPQYGRVYRSGDMGRILHDGTLLIAGRLDDQIKIRGNRVELGEINAVIMQSTSVADCATIVVGEKSAQQSLVTFWVPSTSQNAAEVEALVDSDSKEIAALFERLEETLPAYMIPAVLLPVSRLPLTTQGKLDKRLLRRKYEEVDSSARERFSRSAELAEDNEPLSAAEQEIANALASILRIPVSAVSRHASFFGLGLNSLNAIALAKSLEKITSRRLPISTILRNSNVARLSRVLSAKQSLSNDAKPEMDIHSLFPNEFRERISAEFQTRGEDVQTILPCTPLQEAMLSASSSQDADSYCNVATMIVHGDLPRVLECWQEMVARHGILRTSFVETPSSVHTYAQVVLAQRSVSVTHLDGGVDDEHESAKVDHLRPFRILVLRTKPATQLQLHMHHAIYDGISLDNMYQEVERLYNRESMESPPSVEPFLKEVILHNQDAALDFWKGRFHDFNPREVQKLEDASHIAESAHSSSLASSPLEIAAFCERHSVTPLSIMQAAWAKTLSILQGLSDICFGDVVSGRTVPVTDVDRLVAPCLNTIPVRVQLDAIRSNLDLVRYLHQTNIEMSTFQLTALRRIQRQSQNPAKHLFRTMLLLQASSPPLDTSIWSLKENAGGMGEPLVVEIVPEDDRYDLNLHFLHAFFSESLVAKVAGAFGAGLLSILQFPASDARQLLDYDISKIEGKLAPVEDVVTNGDAPNDADSSEWTSNEQTIRQIFADLAQIDILRISKNTSLYQLGLDSLNAVQVSSTMRRQNLKVDTADVMRLMTPAALAAFLQTSKENPKAEEQLVDLQGFEDKHRDQVLKATDLKADEVEAIRPCTAAQSGMLSQSIQSDGKLFINHTVFEVPPSHSSDVIRTAWKRVQAKHQVLRVGFQHMEHYETPFAMIIYTPGACPDTTLLDDIETSQPELETVISKQMIGDLQHPPWRLTLLPGKTMSMCLSIHHALYDAESLRLILSDFASAIVGDDIGDPETIDPILTYVLQSTIRARDGEKSFWESQLGGMGITKFPSLTPTVVNDTGMGVVQLSSSKSFSQLTDFCKSQSITVQALGQGIWAMLLAAYLGEQIVTFGTVLSGHSDSTPSAAFPGITTVPVVCDTSKTSGEVLKSMVSYNSAIRRFRFTPLSEIQRYAGHVGRPLFDTVFVYQKAIHTTSQEFEWHQIHETAAVDYSVSMEMEVPSSGAVHFRLTSDIRVVPESHAKLILQQFDLLLNHVLDGTDIETDLFSPLISALPPKDATIPSSAKLLHRFVELGAQQHPDRIALEFVTSLEEGAIISRKWTYKQLDERGNQVAQSILRAGFQPGNIVAVCMNKSAEASFAFLGILKAGCAFLAMDPDLPVARKTFILQDSNAKILFTDPDMDFAETGDGVKTVHCTEDFILKQATAPVQIPELDQSSTSYCLYTSGTTGTPKGCELTHENAVQAMMSFQRLFAGRWTHTSKWLQFASYWFDVSVLEQYWSWSVGITLVGAPRDLVLEDLALFIRTAAITHIDLTPSLARLLTPEDVPSLRGGIFITGGEALKQEIISAWGPETTVCNGYGPTEATIGVTMNPLIGINAKPSNIGPQFDNVGACVFIPDTDVPVFRGAVGELCVFGKLVGKGYLNRPELTAKSFPYLEKYSEKFYRTGDLVRMLSDGSFSFIGRKDTQAKLRGQRLEIDEIDAVIKSSTADVAEVATLVVKSAEGNRETLVSFIAAEGYNSRDLQIDTSNHAKELSNLAERACRDHLPGYMVPTHFLIVSRLPLTVNNKVDTKKLVALFDSLTPKDLQELKQAESRNRDMNSSERKIAGVLGRILSIDVSEMQPSSNIFSLGLSSVSVISLAAGLKREGLASANVATIMRNPIIERMAAAFGNQAELLNENNLVRQAQLSMTAFTNRCRGAVCRALSTEISEIESIAPCTPLQEGLLVESLRDPNHPYFNHFRYNVDGLELPRLKKAIQELTALMPILRTIFVGTDDGHAQVVMKRYSGGISVHELQEDDDLDNWHHSELSRWIARSEGHEFVAPFEVLLFKSLSRVVLIMHAHHSIYDGISWDLLMGHLTSLYNGDVPTIGPKFLDSLPHGPLMKRPDAPQFWSDRLRGVQFCPLPVAYEGLGSHGSLTIRTTISDISKVEKVRRRLGVSHQSIIQAAFAVALAQYSPDTKTYGAIVSGRSIPFEGADQVVGPLFNTLPQAIDIEPGETWERLIHKHQASNNAVLPFQNTPLRDIKKICNMAPSSPVFDAIFVCQQGGKSPKRASDIFDSLESDVQESIPLAFEAEFQENDSISVTVVAQRALQGAITVKDFAATFVRAINTIGLDDQRAVQQDFEIPTTTSLRANGSLSRGDDLNGVANFEWTKEADILRTLLAQVIGCSESSVDEHSTLYSLGLDSIDAVKLSSRMKRAGIPLAVSKILKAQTIPRMLSALESSEKTKDDNNQVDALVSLESTLANLPEIDSISSREDVERVIPATPGQEAILAEMFRSNLRQYFNHDVLQIAEHVDLGVLKSAWQAVINLSPILRTSFVEVSNPDVETTFAQVIHRAHDLHIEEVVLPEFSDISRTLDIVRERFATSPQGSAPLLSITLIRIKQARYMALSLSHAQYDGYSLGLLHDDVSRAYDGALIKRPSYDHAISGAFSAITNDARLFWQNVLTGAKPTILASKPAAAELVVHRAEHASAIETKDARSKCQELGITMQTLAQTTFALLLASLAEELDVVFGIVLACRDSETDEQIMFPLMNTVPMRVSLHDSCQDILQDVQRFADEILSYRKTPLRKVQAASAGSVKTTSSTASTNLFNSIFLFQQRPELSVPERIKLYESVDGSADTDYPLAMELEPVGSEMQVRVACKGEIGSGYSVSALLERYDHILTSLVKFPNKPALEFSSNHVSILGLPPFPLKAELELPFAPKQSDHVVESADEQPSPTEDAICKVLTEVAKLDVTVSRDTAIDTIGIDSISVIKASALLRRLDIKLSATRILKAKTARQMAKLLVDQAEQPNGHAGPTSLEIVSRTMQQLPIDAVLQSARLRPSDVENILPATAGQVYLISMWEQTDGQLFFPAFQYQLETTHSRDEIRTAWQTLVERIPILRTTFVQCSDMQYPLLQIVLKHNLEADIDDAVAPSPLNGKRAPVRLNISPQNNGYLLELKIHHALYDAVSLPQLMTQFQEILDHSAIPARKITFQDFIAPSLMAQANESRKAFWTRYLQDTHSHTLPQPSTQGAQPQVEIFTPGLVASCDALRRSARKNKLSVQALLFAAYAKAHAGHLESHTGSDVDDLIFGIYMSNRSHLVDLDKLPAPTLNMVPLRICNVTTREIVVIAKDVQDDLSEIGSSVNSSVSLWEIFEWTGVKVDSFLNFLRLPDTEEDPAPMQGNGARSSITPIENDIKRQRSGVNPAPKSSPTDASDARIFEAGPAYQVGSLMGPPRNIHATNFFALQHSIDLEMTITKSGELDVGLFAPEDMLGLSDATQLIKHLKAIVESLE